MEYFKLGKAKISKICLGTWSLGSDKNKNISYGKMSKKSANNILEYAFDAGINFFDTANVYGDAEKKLGYFLRNKRDKVYIAHKVGCVSFDKKLNFSKKIISKQIENSLRTLQTDYLNIVQLYNPKIYDSNITSCMDYLMSIKSMGIINHIGATLSSPSDYIELRKNFKFDTIQCNFNILDQRLIDNNLLELMISDKVKIFTRTVLNFGIFTDEFLKKKDIKFSKSDHRSRWNRKQIFLWRNYIKKIKYNSKSIEEICYRFVNIKNVSSVIIGATNINHIDIAVHNLNKPPLPKTMNKKIKYIYKEYSKQSLKKPKTGMKI
jgi:aryl-alcohol dehydrogenase-like predicted oxidoreductase